MNGRLHSNVTQKGALGLWLMPISSVVCCALFFSWILHTKPDSPLQSVPSRASSTTEEPTRKLKLLVASSELPVLAEPLASDGLLSRAEPIATIELPTRADSVVVAELPLPVEPLVTEQLPVPVAPLVKTEPLAPEEPLLLAELPTPIPLIVTDDLPLPAARPTSETTLNPADMEVLPNRPVDNVPTPVEPTLMPSQLDLVRSLITEASAINSVDVEHRAQALVQRKTLESLVDVSSQLSFATGSKSISSTAASLLFTISNMLSQYEDTDVVIAVTTSESNNANQNLKLSQERGRAIIARLVSQGVDFSRFSLDAQAGRVDDELTQLVQIQSWPESKRNNE